MKRFIFGFCILFGFSLLFAGDAWNQPQLDKAEAFQKLFNGEAKGATADGAQMDSSTPTWIYVSMGVVVVIFTITLGFIMRARKQAKPTMQDEDEE